MKSYDKRKVLAHNQGVPGSSPGGPTSSRREIDSFQFPFFCVTGKSVTVLFSPATGLGPGRNLPQTDFNRANGTLRKRKQKPHKKVTRYFG